MAIMNISWGGVLLRVVLAVVLVLLTFNPSGYSFYHWLTGPPPGITALKAFAGVVLVIGWVGCLRTAFIALGMIGIVLGAALLGTFVWLMADIGWIEVHGVLTMTWVVLIFVGFF